MGDAGRLLERLWRRDRAGLRRAIEALAGERGEPVWLVGGAVRDLLLGREPVDLDLVVEGDAIGFAERLAERLGTSVHATPAFLTATLELEGGGRLDVAAARRETYARPGALPDVEPAAIGRDLERRDFTINTFALALGGSTPRMLSHPDAGADLERRRLRVLHDGSFRDDPTRLLRAVELEVRLDGRMDTATERLARRAIRDGAVDSVSDERLGVEIARSLSRPRAAGPIVRRWWELGLYEALLPGFPEPAAAGERLESGFDVLRRLGVEDAPGRIATTLLLLAWRGLGSDSGRAALEVGAGRWPLPAATRHRLLAAAERLGTALEELASAARRPSRAHRLLADLAPWELAALASLGGEEVGRWVEREWRELRPFELEIAAADLLAHGVAEGPAIGTALQRTRSARLDGDIDRERELDYALDIARERGPDGTVARPGRRTPER